MDDSIKRHEVDRLLNFIVPLGWELKEEKYDSKGVTVTLRRDLPASLFGFPGKPSSSSSSK